MLSGGVVICVDNNRGICRWIINRQGLEDDAEGLLEEPAAHVAVANGSGKPRGAARLATGGRAFGAPSALHATA